LSKLLRRSFLDIISTEVEAKDIKLVEIVMSNKIVKRYDDDEFYKVDGGDDHSSNVGAYRMIVYFLRVGTHLIVRTY